MDTTVNLNAAECIKRINEIGSTTYTNICNGTTQTLNWGGGDWIGSIAIGSLMFFLILMIIGCIYVFGKLIKDGM